MGIDAIKGGRYADAEAYLRKALERSTASYTTPKDGEPFYYLGLALKAQGKLDDAYTALYKSTWSGWRSPGYFALAEIDATKGDYNAALTADQDSLEANANNIQALALKAALLRHTGHSSEAQAAIAALSKIDPLDVHGMTEQWMATNTPASAAVLTKTVSEFPATGLEVAADYMDAGLWQDGTTLLTHIVNTTADKSKVSPLAYYYLAYFAGQMHEADKARAYDQLAVKAYPDYVFPFQMEMIAVLDDAMRNNPKDSRAPYYLGNLLYDWQPKEAQALWEKSASLGADFPVVYRNLALVYTNQGQREKALAALEKGVQCGGNAMVLSDLDKLYEENGVSPAKRLSVIEAHQAVVDRDEVISREINLDIFAGKPDAAIQLLRSRFFRAWEGGGSYSLGDSWINANLERGHQHMIAKQYALALADYQAALKIPDSLQEATGNVSGRRGEISYWIGTVYQATGDSAMARQAWINAAEGTTEAAAGTNGPVRTRANIGGLAAGVREEQAAPYYQALAMEKLGQEDRAKAIFAELIVTGTRSLSSAPSINPPGQPVATPAQRAQVADAHYLIGLGQLGLKNPDRARQELSLALEASPDHYAAMQALSNNKTP
jgi:tetratricopeptide (TPR) repeat protein